MLKYIVTSLALTVGLSHPSIASERTKSLEVVCVDIKTLDKVLTEFGEEAMLTMLSQRDSPRGPVGNPMVLFMNPKTKSWTLVEKNKEEYCVLGAGENISPYYPEKKTL